MDSEEAFQAALDANPADHTTRLVFADWLDERGDIRAAGYRWLGRCEKYAEYFEDRDDWFWIALDDCYHRHVIPLDLHLHYCREFTERRGDILEWRGDILERETRRGSDDHLAYAFANLPPERQAELTEESISGIPTKSG